jgi:UDP-3-O-acyl N-acetylglucosamine deacetylase
MPPQATRRERTIASEAIVRGVSFLSGYDVEVRFRPAEAGTGVVFARRDLPDCPTVPGRVRHVVPRQRRTSLQRGEAVVEMVEHVMAALAGLRIDNCRVELDGPETPGLDGSSLGFVEALDRAGVVEQDRPREVVVVRRPLLVRDGPSTLKAEPGGAGGLVLTYHLDYGDNPIGRQSRRVAISPESFRAELASSRTFLLAAEADALRSAGIGRRTTEADLLVFGPDGPIRNTLRYPDECARHKVLDMLGDLALLGCDLVGEVIASRTGHQHNAELVRAVLAAAADVEQAA